MSQDKKVRIKASNEGLELRMDDFITFTKSWDWEEVSEITIDVLESNLKTVDSNESELPLEMEKADVVVGNGVEEPISAATEFWENVEDEVGIETIHGEDEVYLQLPEERSATGCFRDFVEFMFDNGYMSKDDLPVKAPRAKKNFILNSEPKNDDGEKMPGASEAINGVYFESKTPRDHKKNYIKILAEKFADA